MKRRCEARMFAKRWPYVLVLCIVFGLITAGPSSIRRAVVLASTPATHATPASQPKWSGASPVASPEVDAPGSFASFGYEDATARGMYAWVNYTFPLPLETSVPEGGSVTLRYRHSPLLIGNLSTLTVLVNGQSIASVRLTEETAAAGELTVDLPTLDRDAESITIALAFHLRLTGETCEVPDDPALWATISKTSSIQLPVASGTREFHLADAPRLLRRSSDELDRGPRIVLPAAPSSEELDAAGIVSYQIGRWSGQSNIAPTLDGVVNELPGPAEPAVVIGTGEDLNLEGDWGSLQWQDGHFLIDGKPVPDEDGVLAIRQQPIPQLLVSGASPEAVLRAAEALSRPMDWPAFDAPVVVISGPLPEANDGRYAWGDGAASFAQLGQGRQDITGPGEHFVDLQFQRPAGWVLAGESTLHLDLNVSPAVRKETSWVRVVINGLDIGTQPLDSGNDVHTYVFPLPVDRLNTTVEGNVERNLDVQLRIFLDYPHQACESLDPQASWLTLMPTSAWFLPHDSDGGMDLGRFPAGLVAEGDGGGMSVVVPDEPSPEEMTAALQVVAAAGYWNAWSAPLTPRLLPAAQAADAESKEGPVVVIGGPNRNALAANIDTNMPSDLAPAADDTIGSPFGILGMGRSPWSENDVALVVAGSGKDGEGILLAAEALGDGPIMEDLRGSRAVITRDLGSASVSGNDAVNAPPADLAPRIVPDARPWIERLAPWQVIGAIVLIAFVALVIGVIQLRWIRGGRR